MGIMPMSIGGPLRSSGCPRLFARPAGQGDGLMNFNIRLWGLDQLLDAVLGNYDLLSSDVRSSLSLKRLWALVQEEVP